MSAGACTAEHREHPFAARIKHLRRFGDLPSPVRLADLIPVQTSAKLVCVNDLYRLFDPSAPDTFRPLVRAACRLVGEHVFFERVANRSCSCEIPAGHLALTALSSPNLDDEMLAMLAAVTTDAPDAATNDEQEPFAEALRNLILADPRVGPLTFATIALGCRTPTASEPPDALRRLFESDDRIAQLSARLVRDGFDGTPDELVSIAGLLADRHLTPA